MRRDQKWMMEKVGLGTEVWERVLSEWENIGAEKKEEGLIAWGEKQHSMENRLGGGPLVDRDGQPSVASLTAKRVRGGKRHQRTRRKSFIVQLGGAGTGRVMSESISSH